MDPTPGSAPRAGPTPSNDRAHATAGQDSSTVHPSEERASASETLYESRGNLDTLAAAALKPLADDRYRARRNSSPPRQQQPAQPHRGHSLSPCQDPDGSRAEARSSGQDYRLSAPDDHGLRRHYREHGQQPSDEDSEEGQSPQSRRPTRQAGQGSRQHQRGQSPSPRYTSRSPRRPYEQDQASRPSARSTMSISSLLDIQVRPQSRGSSQSDDTDSETQSQEHQHHQHNHGRVPRYRDDGPETNMATADTASQSHHPRHEQAMQLRPGDMAHHHHRLLPHQHHQHLLPAHQHPHGHVHHHHPQLAAHQHTHPHPLPPHHRHHHVHHHHLQGKSASPASAFSYVPRSLGLRLDPKLKVNATQVYISYLIQLDQMQRAQHLMRSSEKKKSIHDPVATQAESLGATPHKHIHRIHSRTPSSGEPTRDAQVIPIAEEEIGEHDTRPCSPLLDTSGQCKTRHSQRPEEADMAHGDSGSQQVVVFENSERISRQGPTHAHVLSRLRHQSQHTHVHAHAHHSAPVLPVHIHPAQHHHHIVPSTAKVGREVSKANGSQIVHRNHALHHHHPHHHPYHPSHPNHQHHFHRHPHPTGHNHSHNHHPHGYALMHGHNHAHVHHTLPHGHGSHVHTHAHNHSPLHENNNPAVEHSHREQSHSRSASQPLALPAPSYSSKADSASAMPGVMAASPSTPPAQGHDRLSDDAATVDKDDQRAGRDRVVGGEDGVARQEKDMEIEDPRKQQEESGTSSPPQPQPAPVEPIPTLASVENTMNID